MRADVVGRDRQLERIAGLIDPAMTGGHAIALTGPAGAGKTTLTETAAGIARARGLGVLTCSGVQSETRVGLAGLHQLLHAAMTHADQLPEPQRGALLSVFGLGPGTVSDRETVYGAVLGLLAILARERPLLLVIEDVHWMDRPTVGMIGHLLRRLGGLPILVLLTRRPEGEDGLHVEDELFLGPLPAEDARSLVLARHPDLPDDALRRVLDHAEGNPLALIELAHGQAGGLTGFSGPARLHTRLEESYAVQVSALPAETRDLLLLAATTNHPTLPELAAAARMLGLHGGGLHDGSSAGAPADALIGGALAAAENAGLVSVGEDGVTFRHPLIRSAIYDAAGLHERIRTHRALADALTGSDPSRAAWHRAAGTIGRDEEVAAELERAAARDAAKGSPGAAMRSLERAAELTPSPTERTRRLTLAAAHALAAGFPDDAARLDATRSSIEAGGGL